MTAKLAIVAAVLFATPLVAFASMVDTIPAGLNPGDEYRLIFVTSETITAASSSIGDYDTFVNNLANAAGSPLQSLGATWQAIVSTPTVLAIDHVVASTAPIYRLDGQEVAASSSDLWSTLTRPLINPVLFDEKGENSNLPSNLQLQIVWTGTAADGSANNPLGGEAAFGVGCTTITNSSWIELTDFGSSTIELPVYGISSVLTVPLPEPGPAGIFVSGILLLVVRKSFTRFRRAPSARG